MDERQDRIVYACGCGVAETLGRWLANEDNDSGLCKYCHQPARAYNLDAMEREIGRLLRFRNAVERAVYNLEDSPKSLLSSLRALLGEKEADDE